MAPAQPSPRQQRQQAAAGAALATLAARREVAPPAAPQQLSPEEQQQAAAAASAAAAAADHMAQLLMVRSESFCLQCHFPHGDQPRCSLGRNDQCCHGGPRRVECITPAVNMQEEEVAESAATGAKQARKKAQKSRNSAKKAAKAAATSPSPAGATPEAAAAAQLVDQPAACGSGVRSGMQPTYGSDASAGAEAQPPAGSGADDSWAAVCPDQGARDPAGRQATLLRRCALKSRVSNICLESAGRAATIALCVCCRPGCGTL